MSREYACTAADFARDVANHSMTFLRCDGHLVVTKRMASWHIDLLLEGIEDSLADEIAADDEIMTVSQEARDDLARLIEQFLAERATFRHYDVANIVTHNMIIEV